MDELRWTGGLWRVRRAALEKLKIPTGSQGQKMPPYVLQQLFPWHTHAHTLFVSFIALWFIRPQTIICHIWDTYAYTHRVDTPCLLYLRNPLCFDWTSIENTFFLLQKAGLYLAVFIDLGLSHYTVLFSISQIHSTSPDTLALPSALPLNHGGKREKNEEWIQNSTP